MDIPQKIISNPKYTKDDKDKILLAFDYAQRAHLGQKRRSGEDYISHPLKVAEILADWNMDTPTIIAALLHDVAEDTNFTIERIRKDFGKEIASLVEGVTKLRKIGRNGDLEDPTHVASLKKMFFAMADDIRVIIIKLADRLHNISTLEFMSPEDQKRIAIETMEIYAPIAERLGMGDLTGELEDLAFKYAQPEEYTWLMNKIKDKYLHRKKYIDEIKPEIKKRVLLAGIKIINIDSRVKHLFSLHRKLLKYDRDPNRVYDLVALRIIVPDVKSCYETMGVIHKYYRPLPGLVKDYIAFPKPSGYQSLHTTVFCEGGKIVEIQIRTPEMHDYADKGIAAHWLYSESGKKDAFKINPREVQWIMELRNFLKGVTTGETLDHVKSDFLKSRIFAFTPNGQIKDLPRGSTPIDFAYRVHTDLGHRTRGARVNNRIVPLEYELKNGEVVEIIKGKDARPSRDWLRLVKTNQARHEINVWLKEHSAVESVKKAIKILTTNKKTDKARPIIKPGSRNKRPK
ncbi:MAG: GTP pyrophosphokinase [Candidatus Yanofskybacteria bacterium GW2011_GWD2_39_48]|uniref:GTP pyrophosphokinase n=1 Tax=Candidatus Yanofskybacteria bacterium GW2011_GWD2_39_48 TaxID=1619031 RepID=A0A0G0SDC4_9BACT|nr:MAG: GTP pyrophosphokinase [Candidatus Yanofskybacteria bacterium GW2011_GWD2_39_48]